MIPKMPPPPSAGVLGCGERSEPGRDGATFRLRPLVEGGLEYSLTVCVRVLYSGLRPVPFSSSPSDRPPERPGFQHLASLFGYTQPPSVVKDRMPHPSHRPTVPDRPKKSGTGQDVIVINPTKLARVRAANGGMTQYQLADKSGVSRSFISDIERGRRVPRRLAAEALARALGVELSVLQDG